MNVNERIGIETMVYLRVIYLMVCATLLMFSVAQAEVPKPQPAVAIFEQLGVGPFSIVAEDLNGDGVLDFAVTNFDSDNVVVFFGGDDNHFRTTPDFSFAAGSQPRAVASDDLNGNGFNDLVVANAATGELAVLFNDGQGGFSPAPGEAVGLGFGLVTVELADVNSSGYPDIVTTDFEGNAVKVLLNDGSGAFPPQGRRRFQVGSGPLSVAVGDVDGDGFLDIATSNFNAGSVTLLLGDGAGGFAEASDSPFSSGDELNIAKPINTSPHDSLLLPSASFGIDAVTIGVNPIRVQLADVTGNGNLDLLTANFTSGDLSVLLGDGAGSFSSASGSPFQVGSTLRDLEILDVNGSGFLDAVVLSLEGDAFYVMIGDGEGRFEPYSDGPFPVGEAPAAFVAGEFNNKANIPGIVTVNYQSNNITVHAGDGTGSFAPTLQSPLSFGSDPADLALGDISGNGDLDIIVARSARGDAFALYNDSEGRFDATASLSVEVGKAPKSIGLGDLSGNGVLDLMIADSLANRVSVFLGDGQGAFSVVADGSFDVGTSPRALRLGDVNGNGHLDAIVANYDSNEISILLGDGTGGFSNASGSPFPSVGEGPRAIALGDLNGNSILDLVSVSRRSGSVSLFFGDGAGGFTTAGSPIAVGIEPSAVALADLSGNGALDIVTANSGSDDISILLGDGIGGFSAAPGSPLVTDSRPVALGIGDVSGDGHNDIVIANLEADTLTVYFGSGDGQFSQASGSPVFLPGGGPVAVALADLDHDGRLDIIVVGDRQGAFSEHITVLTSDLVFRDRFEMRVPLLQAD